MGGEAALLVLGWALARWLGIELIPRRDLDILAVPAGVLVAAPLFAGLRWTLATPRPSVRDLVELVQNQLGPMLASRSVIELALLAMLAGAAEEIVFRGVLQAWLMESVPDAVALLVASAVFGLAHYVSRVYALLAAIAGLYLGCVFWLQGNLLVPIVAHGVYDLVALSLLVRRYRAAQQRVE